MDQQPEKEDLNSAVKKTRFTIVTAPSLRLVHKDEIGVLLIGNGKEWKEKFSNSAADEWCGNHVVVFYTEDNTNINNLAWVIATAGFVNEIVFHITNNPAPLDLVLLGSLIGQENCRVSLRENLPHLYPLLSHYKMTIHHDPIDHVKAMRLKYEG